MFLSRNKKNNVYPCKPQFYYIKVGFKGVKFIQAYFHDASRLYGTQNGFHSIAFGKISVLDSHFIRRYIIIRYKPFGFGIFTTSSSRPCVRNMVNVRYLLKRLVYSIHILYTGILSENIGQVRCRVKSANVHGSYAPCSNLFVCKLLVSG